MYGMYLEAVPKRDDRNRKCTDEITMLSKVVVQPRDGPPVELATFSVYLTETPGNRVAFIELLDIECFARLKTGQVVRVEIEESSSFDGPVVARHVIEQAAIDCLSRKGEVHDIVKSIVVVTEIGRGGR